MTEDYKYLKEINFPADLRKLSESQLQDLSNEVRAEMIRQFLKLVDIWVLD